MSTSSHDTTNRILTYAIQNRIKQIPEHPQYWITNDGKVLSLKRRSPKFLREQWNRNGRRYFVVDGRCITAARLIAFAFHPESHFKDAEADHINNCIKDDYAENIQWLSPTDNRRKHHGHPLGQTWAVLSPAGKIHQVDTPTIFAKLHGINPRSFGEMQNRKRVRTRDKFYLRKSVQGWRLVESLDCS